MMDSAVVGSCHFTRESGLKGINVWAEVSWITFGSRGNPFKD